jgi:hypothetical protein
VTSSPSFESLTIDARTYWVETHFLLREGAWYAMTATGSWLDWHIESGPAGYDSKNVFQRLTERLRRAPSAPWFAVVGAVDRRADTQFVIGAGCAYLAVSDGTLTCFANDLPGFYWNNRGAITLVVREIAQASATRLPVSG